MKYFCQNQRWNIEVNFTVDFVIQFLFHDATYFIIVIFWVREKIDLQNYSYIFIFFSTFDFLW